MIQARLYSNGDDCFLVWSMPRTPGCRGFAIARENTTAQGKHYSGYIHNRTGFQGERNEPHEHRPSSEWPFQRYTWTDHQVSEGDRVSYSIAPVLEKPTGLEVDKTSAAALGPIEVSSRGAGKVEAFFNRGIWLSQFMAKQLGDHFTTAEVTRRDFLLGQGGVIGHAIIHSKMIVIDPFTNPVVVTGSHNFSQSASTKNDENLVIVQGNHALAERYAVNIMAAYQHYRWRAYLQQCTARGIQPWQGLKRNDNWQKVDAATDPELTFWLNPDGHRSTRVTP